MYTIRQAATRSGVSVALLRAWERRYGIVEPSRTASGYRLYDDASIARLRQMRRLVDEGWSPSNAAAELRTADEDTIRRLDAASATAIGPSDGGDGLADRFVSAAADMDEPDDRGVLDEMFARGSFEHVAVDVVMPALVSLGDAWSAGRVDVAAEHAAESRRPPTPRRWPSWPLVVRRRSGMWFWSGCRQARVTSSGPWRSRSPRVALACPSSISGPICPVKDWTEAAVHTSARAAVIGVVTEGDVDPARQVATALRAAQPRLAGRLRWTLISVRLGPGPTSCGYPTGSRLRSMRSLTY